MNLPEPRFKPGQKVRVILNERNKTPREGTIDEIIWHPKLARYTYYIRVPEKTVPTRAVFPQAEEARAGSEAAASKERMKERTPRVDWAGSLKRTFDFDVFACARCGGRLKGVDVPEGKLGSASHTGALGLAVVSGTQGGPPDDG